MNFFISRAGEDSEWTKEIAIGLPLATFRGPPLR
jgi:hypothetical protein